MVPVMYADYCLTQEIKNQFSRNILKDKHTFVLNRPALSADIKSIAMRATESGMNKLPCKPRHASMYDLMYF